MNPSVLWTTLCLPKTGIWGPNSRCGGIWRQGICELMRFRQGHKRAEEEMVGGHHQLNGQEFDKFWETVKDREAWHVAVLGAAKNRTWLSDWSTTMVWEVGPMMGLASLRAVWRVSSLLLHGSTQPEGRGLQARKRALTKNPGQAPASRAVRKEASVARATLSVGFCYDSPSRRGQLDFELSRCS